MKRLKQNSLNPIPYFIICTIMGIIFDIYLTSEILTNHLNHDFKLFEIILVKNTGAAFSFLEDCTLPLIIFSLIALIIIIYELFRNINKYSILTYFYSAILTSGIICNMYERITLGYVQDFISLKHTCFPIFNISDILINFAVLAIISLVITKKYIKND